MSTTGMPMFDTTVQEPNLWLKAVMAKPSVRKTQDMWVSSAGRSTS